jgi:hypothetical protein
MTQPETPTLDRANQHVEQNRAVQSFIIWLRAKGYHIGRTPEPHAGPCLNFEGQDPEDYTAHDSCYLHLSTPQCVFDDNADQLLADFWGLDLEQLAFEREALLAWARSNQLGSAIRGF